jgi:hypothetical protein
VSKEVRQLMDSDLLIRLCEPSDTPQTRYVVLSVVKLNTMQSKLDALNLSRARRVNPVKHVTTIESEERGVPDGASALHQYHRWVCSCGASGPWGHSLWEAISVSSANGGAKRHVQQAVSNER